MAKSKYPNKLDTSVEIPIVRDNITEIGSDVLNSLRSAIFNIEKTLGINPQGAIGNTVSSRLNNALDDNGNITKEALDKSGLLSGPISNLDVSKTAGIDEEKLKLNFPTQLLQDQISILDNRIALFISSLEELNALLSAHVNPKSINRHFAKAIAVEPADGSPSSDATKKLELGTLQEVLQQLYDAHINFTGEGVTSENNSHSAEQIYYNNQLTSNIVFSNDVQGAIDDISQIQGRSLQDSILNLNSNGIIRTGNITDAFEGNDEGTVAVSLSDISYSGPDGGSKEIISFINQPTPIISIDPFDILTLENSISPEDNREYLIESVNLADTGELLSVTVFDGPKSAFLPGISGRITKSVLSTYNENGLNCVARPRYLRSNTPDIQVANPNSATIISSGIRARNINSLENILSIEIDGIQHDIDVYNPSFDIQTIDTIVDKINQAMVEDKLNAFAYKLRALNCYELAISHVLPNNADDSKIRTLKIKEAAASTAHNILGLGYILDQEIRGKFGNTCHVNGKLISDFGNIKKYSSDSLALNPGTTNLVSSGINFLNEGIREGDLCTIEGSSLETDDGTYRVNSVEDETIILDATGSTLGGSVTDETLVYFQRTSAPIGELQFKEINGLIIIDVFLDDLGNINFKRRADVIGHIKDGTFYATVVDFSKNFITDNDSYSVSVTASGYAKLTKLPSLEDGPEVFVGATGRYKLLSQDKLNYITLDVSASGSGLPSANHSITIEGFSEIPDKVLHLCRAVYSTELGFVIGSPSETGGAIPITLDKRTTGTVDDTIISENILERYIQGPRGELRGSGIIRDLAIESVTDNGDGTCSISVQGGIAAVSGVRLEYLGILNLVYNYTISTTSNFYVAIDGQGCLLVEPEVISGGLGRSPFSNQDVAHIAFVEVGAVNITITDLRLFIDNLDYKVLADITVSNDQRFGHFTDLKKAIDYARHFSKMFPDISSPSITMKEGEYEVSEVLLIDFDVSIKGVGPQSVVKKAGDLLAGTAGWPSESPAFLIGSGTVSAEESSINIINGVSFENFTYQGSLDQVGYGSVFNIVQDIITSPYAKFSFKNLNIQGPSGDANRRELGICAGPIYNNGKTLGNISIENCIFNWIGSPPSITQGPCVLNTPTNFYNGIIVSGNIAKNVWGDTGFKSGSELGILGGLGVTSGAATGFIESGNYSDDQ